MMLRRGSLVFLVSMLGWTIGCSTSARNRPENHTVSGFVRYADGSPVTGARITFNPRGGAGLSAEGTCESDGSFTIQTLDGMDGAPAGKYAITLEPLPESPLAREVMDRVPVRIMDDETSDLIVEVAQRFGVVARHRGHAAAVLAGTEHVFAARGVPHRHSATV